MHLERCIPDVWYWWWLLILLDFVGILYFLVVYWLQSKGGWSYSWLIGCSTNSIILRMLVRKGEISLSFTTDMEFPNGMKLSFSSGNVVSVYLLTDRNYVSKSAVILEFLCYLRRGWNFRVSGIVHFRKVVNNRYWWGPRKTNAPQRWHQVPLADVG